MLKCLEGVHQRLPLPLDEYHDAASLESALVEFFEHKPHLELKEIGQAMEAGLQELAGLTDDGGSIPPPPTRTKN